MELNFLRKKKTLPGLCCLYLLPDKLIIAHVLREHNTPPILTFVEVSICQMQSLQPILESIIKKHGFAGVMCSWVLHASYYQLLLLDPPQVDVKEISLALRWQLKELISFPAEEAAIDYFAIPYIAPAKEKIYVAVAQLSALQAIADSINEAGVNLTYIDIPELALRNINALYDDSQCYLGLLAFGHDHIEFIITHQSNLLLSRKLVLPESIGLTELKALAEAVTPSPWLSDLIAEIQHSFTYCQSQQQQEYPIRFIVSSEIPELVSYFNTLLNSPVEQITIEKKLTCEFVLKDDEYVSLDYLIAIGGALREDDSNAAN